MKTVIDIQKQLLPDLLEIMQKRYHILRTIKMTEPVGRRTLSQQVGLTERVLRSEVDFLKSQNLLHVKTSGMTLSNDGVKLLHEMEGMMREISGINVMEQKLQTKLGIHKVVVVPGNSDLAPWVKEELGRATAASMKQHLLGKNIIAVTGGSSMASVADHLSNDLPVEDILFLPARGGIGEDVQNQANTICSKMAVKSGARFKALYVPDQVSKEVYKSLMKEPDIHEILTLLKSANMVLHGIGDAVTMAERRKTKEEDMEKIHRLQAVGEAFGYYFNEQGEVVHKVPTVGLQLDDLSQIPVVLAVAGGESKAKAITAYMKQAPTNTILITDEGAATTLLKG
ncbi:central glycolytic genes regulator [Bacillus coahuilensis p1.1.43]|uniref:Central glycolytic genes regulator n=1 Tax=Bacillus coahuilensis p1.1.43 TaxID=1150625 RepID=A0A147K5V1_9BACI|nr:sugar-binding domain-containing protein [Bacillus coahuilensis]KUP05194.1 central glycolytic genes regulator [Bacillus coahuilensis p1.1.43]